MRDLLRRLALGYACLARRLAVLAVIVVVAAAASAAVVLPSWYLATSHRRIFNVLVGAAVGVLLLVWGIRRSRRSGQRSAVHAVLGLGRVAGIAVWFGLLYAVLWAFASGHRVLGGVGISVLLVTAGLLAR